MNYDTCLAGEPVMITAALTGGVHGKEASPHLLESPEERDAPLPYKSVQLITHRYAIQRKCICISVRNLWV